MLRTNIFEQVVKEVEGRVSQEDCNTLYNLAKQVNDNIIEIGSLYGRSTICLALGLNNRHKVYAIDPHEGNYGTVNGSSSYSIFRKNIKKFGGGGREKDCSDRQNF